MCQVTSFFNVLVDSHSSHQEVICKLLSKLTDLEDCSCKNNLKMSEIPESISSHKLPHFTRVLFKAVLTSLSLADLTIDRIHRVSKPSFLPSEVPLDKLLRIQFFQAKKSLKHFEKLTISLNKQLTLKCSSTSPSTLCNNTTTCQQLPRH